MSDEEKKKKPKKKDLQAQCDEYLAGWKRALADYENLQRDLAQTKEDSRRQIRTALAHELLPIMDNFDQAVSHAPSEMPKELETWMQGVTFIKKQFEDAFASMGIERINVEEPFDPNVHEAVGEAEEMEEVRTGWKIGEHVLRPAQVKTKKEV